MCKFLPTLLELFCNLHSDLWIDKRFESSFLRLSCMEYFLKGFFGDNFENMKGSLFDRNVQSDFDRFLNVCEALNIELEKEFCPFIAKLKSLVEQVSER